MSTHFVNLYNKLMFSILRGLTMIRCHLSTLMGQHKMRISDVSKETGFNRSAITALYSEEAKRIDLELVNRLCKLFGCTVGDLFEFIDD